MSEKFSSGTKKPKQTIFCHCRFIFSTMGLVISRYEPFLYSGNLTWVMMYPRSKMFPSSCRVSDTRVAVKACWPLAKFLHCAIVISLLSPLRKGRFLHLNKFESPSSKDALPFWLKLVHVFWWKSILNSFNSWSLFRYHLSLEKDVTLYLVKLPLKGCFVPSLVKMIHWFWRRTILNFVNVYSLFRHYIPLTNPNS